ncbi:hypothetical protein HY639_04570 [Candidatus Woesearchaeota archaeon]|nr:hypothetical protein [Candidatus Woesearchaeota archaeon]
MAEGKVFKIYSRGSRDATSRIGRIKSGTKVFEFTEKDLTGTLRNRMKKGIRGFKPEDMAGWTVVFDVEGKRDIVDGSMRRK